ncbi:MAG TPA: hypothetical protein ENL15_01090 [Firmicutes bacterium]|nr:hypothetical protein [Bacillota bacterium]
MKRTFLLIILALFILPPLFGGSFLALNSFGKYNLQGDIRSFSMGVSGVALYDDYNTSLVNPATATGKDRIYVNIGETYSSLSIDYERFTEFNPSSADFDTPYLNIIFPLPLKGTILTASYYSPVNSMVELHYTNGTENIEEVHQKNINFTEFGAAYELLPSFSMGIGALYAFGNERNEYTIIDETYTEGTTYNKWKYTYSGIGFHMGALYHSETANIGVSYFPALDINVSRSFNDARIDPDYSFTYPAQWTLGFSLTPGALILTGEWTSIDWSEVDYNNYLLDKMSRLSFGAEYDLKIPYKRHGNLRTFDIPVRAGFYTQKGFYENGKEWGLTGGFSLFPFKSVSGARMDVFLSCGQRKALLEDAFQGGSYDYKENFFTFGISFSATDKWYK